MTYNGAHTPRSTTIFPAQLNPSSLTSLPSPKGEWSAHTHINTWHSIKITRARRKVNKLQEHNTHSQNNTTPCPNPQYKVHNITTQCPNPQYKIHKHAFTMPKSKIRNALQEHITNSSIFADSSCNTKEGNDHVLKKLTLAQAKENKVFVELP